MGPSAVQVKSPQRVLTMLGEILTVIGPIGVLGLWFYQQSEVEERASELRRIAAARAVFQTYQSHNAVFNAVNAAGNQNKQTEDQVRTFQIYNYELGLIPIENVLTDAEKSGIPEPINAYSSVQTTPEKMAQVQKRLELLQTRLSDKEASIRVAADAAQRQYWRMYLILSLLSIAGALCRVWEKLVPVPRAG